MSKFGVRLATAALCPANTSARARSALDRSGPGPHGRIATTLAFVFAAMAAPAMAQTAGSDPVGSGPIVAALGWLEGTLLGNVATAVAVIAVAMVGFMMLTGRLNWRFGGTVIVGCFVLFGASAIVTGIQSTAMAAH